MAAVRNGSRAVSSGYCTARVSDERRESVRLRGSSAARKVSKML